MSDTIFYPDNPQRLRRLQQLINDIKCTQMNIREYAEVMDKHDKDIRGAVNELLDEHGVDNIDTLFKKCLDQYNTSEIVTVHGGLFDGGGEKEQLIRAIGKAQIARLGVVFFEAQARVIIEQLQLCIVYVDMLKDQEEALAASKKVGEILIRNIAKSNSRIDLKMLEDGLESKDRNIPAYVDDDLNAAEVIGHVYELARVDTRRMIP
ncbi:hypothetical protein C8Q75DRAFT_39227 [Abortiporus biennis]|nr:hypothetical protein C8Q75DRAFT_39227 [Abortiporus biennis]